MDYLSYYGMEENLFTKSVATKKRYESKDYQNVMSRLNYLKEIKGIGLLIGSPGLGKTFTLRCFTENLNRDLYKVLYISPINLGKFEFFANIARQLNIDPGPCYKDQLYHNIQFEIKRLVTEQRIQVIIIIDDAQNLQESIMSNLKILFDYQMDSKDYVTLILCGSEDFRKTISKVEYESLQQRIVVNYKFNGLERKEVKEYILSKLEASKQKANLFTVPALNGLSNASKGNPRRLNSLVLNCFIIGYQNKKEKIDEEIVRMAKEELDFMEE